MLDLLYDPSKAQRPRRILLYGVGGIGKTTWARKSGNVIEIPTEDANCDETTTAFPVVKTLEEFCARLKFIRTNELPHDTLVIDSLDWLEPMIWQDICQQDGVKDIGLARGGYNKGYDAACDIWRKLLDGFAGVNLGFRGEDKPKGPGMKIILLAHSRVTKIKEPGLDPYDKYSTPLRSDVDNLVREWCDEVLFCNFRVFVSEKDAGFNKKVTKAIGSDDRVIYTTERAASFGKKRLKTLPAEIPMEWAAYAEHLPGATPTKDTF